MTIPMNNASDDPSPRRTWAVRDAASNVTRLMCAGVYLDESFRDRVLDLVNGDPDRYLAPTYGYDVAPIYRHARSYRDRHIITMIGAIGALALMVLLTAVGQSSTAELVVLLCGVWAAWLLMFFERLYVRSVLTYALRRSPSQAAEDQDIWAPPVNTVTAVSANTATPQDPAAGVVYYSGYRPFVGAGDRTRSWAFPILLVNKGSDALDMLFPQDRRPAPLGAITDVPDSPVREPAAPHAGSVEFTGADLLAYVEDKLRRVLNTEVTDERRIEELSIVRRWYRTAVAEKQPRPPRPDDLKSMAGLQGRENYGSPRQYLCVHIGSWQQEVVASVFVGFDIKGKTLYTDFHAHVLKPIRSGFHEVDLLPREISGGQIVRIAIESFGHLAVSALSAPFEALAAITRFFRAQSRPLKSTTAIPAPFYGGLKDYGARESMREIAAGPTHHHFFQSIDAEKYIAIVERWVDAAILDFLEEQHIDTREFRSKRNELVNLGIIQTGGNMRNDGIAVGTAASVVNKIAEKFGATPE